MRCALVIPAWTPEAIFSSRTAPSQVNYWQPLGTLYVGASLIAAGHEVKLFDGAFLTHEQIVDGVAAFAPQAVGIYSTAFGWPAALKTAADVKRRDASIFVCAGGPYPMAVQERCLEQSEALDAVVNGEAEHALVDMLERIACGRALEGVAGIAYRSGGRIVKNAARALIEDLDSLPFPARELLGDAARYIPPPGTYRRKPVAALITSRGCDRRCLFCFQPDRDRKSGVRGVRFRSIGNVLREIELCLDRGYREIKFLDDTLAADYDRAMSLAREIRARRLGFTWFASVCANQVDAPLLRAFRDAGCWAVLIGAESGVQKNLNALRKGITLQHVRDAVRAAKDAGLQVSTPFVFGIPGETYEEALETIAFAVELDPHLANFHALTAFPGTPLHEQHEKYGTIDSDLTRYTYQGAAFVPYTMTREEIQELRQVALRTFYSRPSFIARKLLALRNPSDCRAAWRGMRSLFWLWAARGLFGRARDAAARSR